MEDKKTRGGARPGAGRPKGVKRPYKVVSVNLTLEYEAKLKEAAAKAGLSVSKFVQMVIDRQLKS